MLIRLVFLACLEAAEQFGVVVWCGLAVSTVSNLNASCIQLELGLGFENTNTHTHTHTHIHTHTHTYRHKHTKTQTQTYTHTHIHTYIHTHAIMNAQIPCLPSARNQKLWKKCLFFSKLWQNLLFLRYVYFVLEVTLNLISKFILEAKLQMLRSYNGTGIETSFTILFP